MQLNWSIKISERSLREYLLWVVEEGEDEAEDEDESSLPSTALIFWVERLVTNTNTNTNTINIESLDAPISRPSPSPSPSPVSNFPPTLWLERVEEGERVGDVYI